MQTKTGTRLRQGSFRGKAALLFTRSEPPLHRDKVEGANDDLYLLAIRGWATLEKPKDLPLSLCALCA